MNRKTILQVAAFAIIIGLMIYGSQVIQQKIIGSVDMLGLYLQQHVILGMLIFFSVSVVAVLLSPFSSVPLVPSAIMAWGNFSTFWLLYLGWIIGGIIAYFIGSFFSEKIIKRFIPLEKVDYYKERISVNSQFWLVLLFRLAIPSEAASYTLGIIRYHFWKYLAVTILTEIIFALFVVYSSAILLSGKILYFSAVIIAGGTTLYFLYRYVQRRIKKQQ